jgi:hypothetical protein
MSERYFATVVKVIDKFTVVINAGSDRNVELDARFVLVGLGDVIVDPDTGLALEHLELVRGTGRVIHVQQKICTLQSAIYDKHPDQREIKKITSRGGIGGLIGSPQDTVTETTKPGDQVLREFRSVEVGDYAIAL